MLSQVSSSSVEVLGGALAVHDPLEDLDQPVGALAARGALAAGLVLVELGQPQGGLDDRVGLVEDHQRGGAEHRAGRPRPSRSPAGRRGARR